MVVHCSSFTTFSLEMAKQQHLVPTQRAHSCEEHVNPKDPARLKTLRIATSYGHSTSLQRWPAIHYDTVSEDALIPEENSNDFGPDRHYAWECPRLLQSAEIPRPGISTKNTEKIAHRPKFWNPKKTPKKYRKNTRNGHFWYFWGIFSVFSGYFQGVQNFRPGGIFSAFFVEIPGRAISRLCSYGRVLLEGFSVCEEVPCQVHPRLACTKAQECPNMLLRKRAWHQATRHKSSLGKGPKGAEQKFPDF